METNEVLECGCEKEVINGKVFWFYCDEHDEDSVPVRRTPTILKYRRAVEDYIN